MNFSFTRNIKGREQITICKHNTLVAVLSPITKKPKIKTEDIVEQIMEFNKDKTLALYTIKELRDESRR
ncbi:type II toxin-antitoxin system Phd/YefM family antitoxin [Rickettsia endosymbiont of Rhinocyllus conicus]|uniref:type II toxin-antitoxin system Phd/YefM family antitoxin n=1 Tax=Rickettsia endosymbiont of Rhinocyllus conicus TaxID=3066252 RepID=UPI003132CC07